MRPPWPKTFFWQLVLGTVLVQALCLIVYISYIVISSEHLAEQRTRQRTTIQLDRLAAACSRELGHGNMASLQDLLDLSRNPPAIDNVRLTDLTGKTLAISHGGQDRGLDTYELGVLATPPQQQILRFKEGRVEAVEPVLRDGKPIALLWFEPSAAPAASPLSAVIRISLTYGALALLANLIPLFLIVRTMTGSLSSLLGATQGVILRQDLKSGFPLPVTTTNEAGELTASFNIMVRELEGQRSGLLETLALLDSMLQNAPIGFAFFDRQLRYVRLNQFLADMYEIPLAEYVGRRGTEIFPGSIAVQMEAYTNRVFNTGEAVRNVELTDEKSPTSEIQRSWLMHFYPVRAQRDTISWVGVIVVEITERLRAEETLRKTEKLAATGRLAASIAHEINNPLEAVTNLLYLLETHEPMDPAATEFVMMAQAELARVSEITQQTLRFYRQATLPGETNVVELLDSVVTLYQPRLNAAHVTVVRDFRGQAQVFGFSGELRQVFANLIGNALDAMPNGGRLRLRVQRGHGCGPDRKWCEGVRICIADTGNGMSPETLARVFEAFFTTKPVTGTGLGLWVTEEIIRKHFGVVRARSRQGVRSGTCFLMFFPDGGVAETQIRSAGSATPLSSYSSTAP